MNCFDYKLLERLVFSQSFFLLLLFIYISKGAEPSYFLNKRRLR